MRFTAFLRFGLFAIAAAVPSWALISTSISCSAPSSAVYGQPVSIAAAVASADGSVPTGTVTFSDGSGAIGSAALTSFGTAQVTATFTPGTHSITCTYSGDPTHAASVSAAALLTVTQATPTITLTASINPVPVGQIVDIYIVVGAFTGAPLGSVTLMDGNTVLAVLLLQQEENDSIAQFRTSTLSAGTHFITARYEDDAFFTPATTKQPLVVVIGRRSTTTLIRGVSPSPAIQVQVTSDIGVPTGSVSVTENSKTLSTATLSGGAVVIMLTNLPAGTHSIVANYSGDAVFDVSSSAPFTLQVNGAATTTQVTATPNPVQAGQTVRLTAAVTSSAGTPSGTVTFQNAQGGLGTANLDATGQATLATSFASPGNQTITAAYAGSAQFAASSSAALSLTVIPRQLSITSASSFKTIVAPDSLATIFGDNLAAGPVSAGLLPWPMMLGGVSVVFRDNMGVERLAALKFVSAGQINAVVPPDTPLGQATVIVRSGSSDVESGMATIADVAPGLFSGDGTGMGAAAAAVEIVHPDGTTSLQQAFRCDGSGKCTTNSIDLGSDGDQAILILFGTGIRRGSQTAKARVGGQDLTPSYAGPQPQYGGVDQVNVALPASLRGAGDVTAQIVIGDQLSNIVSLHFQ